MTFIQRRLNVNATSWRCIDVEATLYRCHVSAGLKPQVTGQSNSFTYRAKTPLFCCCIIALYVDIIALYVDIIALYVDIIALYVDIIALYVDIIALYVDIYNITPASILLSRYRTVIGRIGILSD